MLRNAIAFFILAIFSGTLYGQTSPTAGSTAGSVHGIIADKQSGDVVPFASVTVYRQPDSIMVNGSLTGDKGDFSMPVAFGSYYLKVQSIGYRTFISQLFILTSESPTKSFQRISLSSEASTLEEVQVTAHKADMQIEMDRKVFNVENNLTVGGGSATDVLRQVPSVGVDVDGNVTLRGSGNVTIFIDGKPSALVSQDPATALEQIPSANIEKVEVITNPSAKYDAEGMSGIINIVLKKNATQGINGTVTGGVGTGEKYNGGTTLNYQNKKVSLFGSYNYRNQRREGTGESSRYTFFPDTSFTLDQESSQLNHNINHTVRGGGEVTLTPNSSASFSATYNKSDREETESFRNREYDVNDVLTRLYDRHSTNIDNNHSLDILGGYKTNFGDPRRQLTIDGSYSSAENKGTDAFSDVEMINEERPASIPAGLQNTYDNNKTRLSSLQSDYVQPFGDGKSKLEAGLKAGFRNINSGFYSESYDTTNAEWVHDTLLDNNFTYSEGIYAGYASYSGEWQSVKFKAGLRGEYTNYTIEQLSQVSTYTNRYVQLFPSLYLTKTVAHETDLQLSYSKRINRPSLNALNPVTDYSDPLNLRTGNPALKPELIHSFELSVIRYRDALTLNATIYYRYVMDQIQRFHTVDTNGVATTTQVNLNNGQSYGAEASARWQLSRAFDATLSGNVYRVDLDGGNLEQNLGRTAWGGSSRLLLNSRLPKDFSVQATGDFTTGQPSVMGTMKPFYSLDLGLRKDLFKKQLSLNLSLTDVFNTRKFAMDLEGSNYTQSFVRKRESRVLTLNATWKFGRVQDNQGKKKQRDNQQSQPSEMQEDY